MNVVLLVMERDSRMLSSKELPSSDVALAEEGIRRVGVEGSSCSAAAVIGCITGVGLDSMAGEDLGHATGVGRCRELD